MIDGLFRSAHSRILRHRGLTVLKSFAGLSFANVLVAFAQYVLLGILSRNRGAEDTGIYLLALAYTTPITVLLGLELRTIALAGTQKGEDASSMFVARAVCYVVGLPTLLLLLTTSGQTLVEAIIVLLIYIDKCVDGIVDLAYGFLLSESNNRIVAAWMISRTLLVTVGAGLAATAGFMLLHIAGIMLATKIVLTWFAFRHDRKHSPTLAGLHLRDLLRQFANSNFPRRFLHYVKLGAPLSIAASISSTIIYLPRFWLDAMASKTDIAAFGAIQSFAYITGLIVLGATQSFLSNIARGWLLGDSMMVKSGVIKCIASSLVLILLSRAAIALLASPLLQLTFGSQFARYASEVITYSVLTGLAGVFWPFVAMIGSIRKAVVQFWLSAATLVLSVPITSLFVSAHSLWGAVIAGAISLHLLAIPSALYFWHAYRRKFAHEQPVNPIRVRD